MLKNKFVWFLLVIIPVLPYGCATSNQQGLQSSRERALTLGIVQKEIHAGMSQAAVAEALGSPNLVTRDAKGHETWIYDKVASESSYSQTQGGMGGIGGIGAGISAILAGGSFSKQSGAASSTEKTLTVVIKFDSKQKVESYSYQTSKF